MMLLTAFVLVIGFVALTGMVARVSQLPEATQVAADRPIYVEGAAVARGVEQIMEDLNNQLPLRDPAGDDPDLLDGEDYPASTVYGDDFAARVHEALLHLVTLESARGYRLQLAGAPVCDDASGTAIVSASFSLADTETSISFTISYSLVDAWHDGIWAGSEVPNDPTTWSDGVLEADDGDMVIDAPDEDAYIGSCSP